MTLEIISRSNSTKVWDWAEIELVTPASAVRVTTDCAMGPGFVACLQQRYRLACASVQSDQLLCCKLSRTYKFLLTLLHAKLAYSS